MDILLYVMVFVVLGVLTYFADRRYGERLYRWCWNLSHKDPLPADAERGFIVGRKNRERITPAVILTLASMFALHYLGEHDVVTVVLKGALLMFPGYMIGFFITGLAMREGKPTRTVADKVFKVMDDIEEGKMSIGGAAGEVLGAGVERMKAAATNAAEEIARRTEKRSTESKPAQSAAPGTQNEHDAPEVSLEKHLENMRKKREGQ